MSQKLPFQRWWIWLLYFLLFSGSIPWYLPEPIRSHIWLGLPAWVMISLLTLLAISLFTVIVVRGFWSEWEDE